MDTAELEQAIAYLRSVVAKEFHPRGTHKIAVERVIAGAEAYLAGWRPIETAPKDGTPIMLWTEYAQCVGLWERSLAVWAIAYPAPGEGCILTEGEPFEVWPTKWRPLPFPPAYQDARKEAARE